MDVRVSSRDLGVRGMTRSLLRRMVSPLCGLDKGVSFSLSSVGEPTFMSAGAELTGVHVLLDEPAPREGSYHIGGSGVFREEVLIRVLAETTERYAQVMSEVSGRHTIVEATHDELTARGERVISPDKLRLFTGEQLADPGLAFQAHSPDRPMGWLQAPSLLDDGALWVPAQLLILGYRPKPPFDEPWLLPAVTTGTASHTSPSIALRNAVLELVQIDSAMGHWYSAATAKHIVLDGRTDAIRRIVAQRFDPHGPQPEFYWLQSPDLEAMTIACLIRGPAGGVPAVAIGLGCDLRLVDALYKALLEAVGVVQMAKIVLLQEKLDEDAPSQIAIDPEHILDFDRNVAYYALPGNRALVDEKFDRSSTVPASHLPEDSTGDVATELRALLDRSRANGMEWVYLDLTTADIRELGFTTLRAWSPDLISLCLPSAPPLSHPRFAVYGGATHARPHPYP